MAVTVRAMGCKRRDEWHADLEEVCAALSDHAPRTLDSICKHPDEA